MRKRCGAPLPDVTDKRRKHDTCRAFVTEENPRCYRHPATLTVFSGLMTEMLR